MRIGIDARMYGAQACTGIGQYIKQLTAHLFKIDKQNEYVLFLLEDVFNQFTAPGKQITKVKVSAPWYSYSEQLSLPLQLVGHKLDLIHYPHFNSPIFFPKKSVCTIHDLTAFKFEGHKMKSRLRKKAHRLIFGNTVKRAEKILTVSNSTKQELITQFKVKANKIIVTYLGVDERFCVIDNHDIIKQVKQKYGITKPFIFFVGAWRNHKNFEGLICAFEILKNQYSIPHQLVLGGQEDLHYPNIRKKINASKFKHEIITPGFIDDNDLAALYNAAEVFCLPSFIEGFGIIAIEAQACGCPVASANTSCLPEILQNSALFFDPNNHRQMAAKIYQILNNQNIQQDLIARGFENIKRFSWQNCAQQTLEVYNQILKK